MSIGTKKRNEALDLFKLVAAVFVTFIHVRFPGDVGEMVSAIARFAVPMFFMISGYYGAHDECTKIIKKARHIAWMLAHAAVFYLIVNSIKSLCSGWGAFEGWILEIFSWREVLRLLLLNSVSWSEPLWFLPALIYTYLVWWCVKRARVSHRIVYTVSLLLLIVHLCFGELSFIHGYRPETSIYVRNFLFFGFPFFSFGVFIREHESGILRLISTPVAVVMIVFGSVLAALSVWLYQLNEFYIGTIPTVLALFVLALRFSDAQIPKCLKKLSRISTAYYILHPLAISLFWWISSKNWVLGTLKPIFAVLLTVLLSAIFLQVGKYAKSKRIEEKSLD